MDISLYYFPPWNRAEPMRMLMMHAGVTFNDVIVKPGDWMQIKPTMPDGVIPAIKFNHKGKPKLLG